MSLGGSVVVGGATVVGGGAVVVVGGVVDAQADQTPSVKLLRIVAILRRLWMPVHLLATNLHMLPS